MQKGQLLSYQQLPFLVMPYREYIVLDKVQLVEEFVEVILRMLATHYRTATFFTLPSLYFTIFNPLVGADNR